MSQPRPSRTFEISRPSTILALLTALNFLNYVDRYLVAAVAPKFQEDLSLSSFATGFVSSAFMLGYFVTSPLFGWLSDRPGAGRSLRTWLIAIGVAVWSLATVASGLSKGATSLILARVVVGVGEASYATIAPTIIDDLAPPARRNRWLAVFYVAIPVGSALGYILGGILEHRFGWRGAFFVAGGPGVLCALAVLLIREPSRGEVAAAPRATHALRTLWRAPLYVACVGGLCAYTFALGGFAAWVPKFLYAVHAMPLATADFGFGVVAVVAGLVGTVVGGVLADRGLPPGADDETRVRKYLHFSAIATAIAIPAAVATLWAPSARTFFLAIFVCETALFASTSPINSVILASVPPGLRATAMAASIFVMHALGDFPSPPLVGAIADVSTLRKALAILPVAVTVCAILWFRARRAKLVTA